MTIQFFTEKFEWAEREKVSPGRGCLPVYDDKKGG
jgi:hypothetical protein